MRERTSAQVAKNYPSARVQHTQASRLHNEETRLMRSATEKLALTLALTRKRL